MRERRPAPEGYPSGPDAALVAHDLPGDLADMRALVLVEGVSDRIALDTLAGRRGVVLRERGVVVAALGGAQGLGRMLLLVPRHPSTVLCGLYDAAEHDVIRAQLIGAGVVAAGTPIADAGFFACDRDLEDELIRACGTDAVEACIAAEGELTAFRRMQGQPQWRGRPVADQLRRWIAGGSRRKLRYARILVEAAPEQRMPQPLVDVLERAITRS